MDYLGGRTCRQGDLLKFNLLTKEKTKIQGFPGDLEDSLGGFGDNTGKFEVLLDPDFNNNKYNTRKIK